ncbi:MAG: ABC transporter ATP-binding protein [Burkholderiaceae bacterium]|nr:ABC transporter ATP-binding protein [Burkholderiaceae bacterium]
MSLLEVRGLTKRFGGLVATDRLDLSVAEGELHAVIGPNGAGKTTLIGQLAGTLRPDAGSIVMQGLDVTRRSAHTRVARGIARSYQVTNVFRRFTALDNAALAIQACSGSSFRFWRSAARETALFERARALLDRVGLRARADVPAGALAHGEQRQLEVALALASQPRLLLLDEPMAGMGPDESERMLQLIASLKGRVTIVLVEHDMDAVFRLADRLSVLVYGRVLATGTPPEIRANADVRQAYLGAEATA